METVAVRDGVRYVNSSIDTTPSRTAATLRAQSGRGRLLLLLGGRGKALPLTPLTDALRGTDTVCFLFGAAREELAAAPREVGCSHALFASLEDAFRAARAEARTGDTVLLSPAATSYDAFADFEARGARFRALVAETEK
jgi:UDP-N-acetylmuramoylalanine--D-glutamate ligase